MEIPIIWWDPCPCRIYDLTCELNFTKVKVKTSYYIGEETETVIGDKKLSFSVPVSVARWEVESGGHEGRELMISELKNNSC